ncbi:MAG: ABC transporter ATP-binding protein [Nitrospirae bacterium]|nr:ABC transporter ATP-binding protein [Magnetococcales bacterium]HAT51179.1 ABC transporter ATP-binding protein [Alphaproteobacteria bacterium]
MKNDSYSRHPSEIGPDDFSSPVPKSASAFLFLILRQRFPRRVVVMAFMASLSIFIMGFEPQILRHLVNALSKLDQGETTNREIWYSFAILGGLWLASSLCNRLYQIVDLYTSPKIRFAAQSYLFAYLLHHSPRYFQENFAGKLGQKIKQAGGSCLPLLSILLHDTVRIITILIMGIIVLWPVWPLMAILVAGWSVIFLVTSSLFASRCSTLSYALSDEMSSVSGRMIDAIANSELVRAFSHHAYERWILSNQLDRELKASERLRWFLILMQGILYTATIGFHLSLIAMAMHQVLAGHLTVGDFMMVFSMASLIVNNVWTLSQRMLEFYEHLGILGEAVELVAQKLEISEIPQARKLQVTGGEIRVNDLHFSHHDGRKVFTGLNLVVHPGEKIGLVGPSGAGKSTLLKLLRRQFEPQRGSIFIDGQDIYQVTLDSLNDAFAEVPQLPGLFHRSIGENILYARIEASWKEVLEAARKSHCHEFIGQRQNGYDTIVGEQGVRLSGGEKQRVAIARAFLKDAPILILDEATSSLDSHTEHLIQEALWHLMANRTVIAVAHRLSTLTDMDRILYMENGQIMEQGSHSELIHRCGLYANLWARQSGGFLPRLADE